MLVTLFRYTLFALGQKIEDPILFLKKAWLPELDPISLTSMKERLSAFQQDIRNGMLHKKQGKSDHWVVIPLRPEAYEILIQRFNNQVPKTNIEELNRHIKKVGQLASINIPIKASYKKGNQDIVTPARNMPGSSLTPAGAPFAPMSSWLVRRRS